MKIKQDNNDCKMPVFGLGEQCYFHPLAEKLEI